MKYVVLITLLLSSAWTFGQEKNKIVTLGTFHFHLVQAQFGVDFDINSKERQAELNEMIEQIEDYGPTKIFVEWEYSEQAELDTLYALYLKDRSYELIKQKYGKNETMYFDSEVQHLGFKLADKLGHKKIYAFDYPLPEPNDTVMSAIQKADQTSLMEELQKDFGEYGQMILSKFQTERSIKSLLLFFNSRELEDKLNGGYISLFNKAGGVDDFSGPYFVSERFRRNLYMYSLIQKQIERTDERIFVIVGGQHAAGMRDFIRDDKNLEQVDIETILK